MDIRAEIQAGACGFGTVVLAGSADGMTVQLRIDSDCPKVMAMANELAEVQAMDEVLTKPLVETTPALLATKHRLHSSCPLPIGILKAVEAAAGLALPATCTVVLSRMDE
jgi:uncharacterized protein DUF6951